MNFYIKQIKLWFKTHPQPIIYTFKPNKVNVITGDSSTGKSSILRVIDYCLLAPESTIVEDVINENVSWYGLNFHLNGHNYVIARKAPSDNGTADRSFYWAEDSDEMPNSTPRPTSGVTRAFLLSLFNQKFACENLTIKRDKKEVNISFRNFLLLNFLTEDIIATFNSYFDPKFFSDENLDGIVAEIFKLGIGTDELQELTLNNQIKLLKEEVSRQIKNKENDQKNDIHYRRKIDTLRTSAKNLGFLIEDIDISSEEFIKKIKTEIQEFNKFRDSRRKQQEIKKLEYEAEEIQEQLRRYNILRRAYNKAKRYAEKVKDSLSPVEYLKNNLDRVILGVETIKLLHSLEEAYQSAAQIELPDDYLPTDMEQRVSELKKKLAEINAKQEAFNKIQYNRLFDQNWLAQTLKLEDELKRSKPVTYKYIGDIEFTNINDLLKDTTEQYNQLSANNEKRVNGMINHVQSYYELQDGMSDNYKNKTIGLDETKMILKLYNNGSYYPIRNIGDRKSVV